MISMNCAGLLSGDRKWQIGVVPWKWATPPAAYGLPLRKLKKSKLLAGLAESERRSAACSEALETPRQLPRSQSAVHEPQVENSLSKGEPFYNALIKH